MPRISIPWKPLEVNRPDDDGFIFRPWIEAVRPMAPFSEMGDREYLQQQKRLIEALVAPGRVVIAASPKGEPYYGFICWQEDPRALHYIYVRNPWRQKGIATGMMKYAGFLDGEKTVGTSWTRCCPHYRHKWRLVYNPFLAWEKLNGSQEEQSVTIDLG